MTRAAQAKALGVTGLGKGHLGVGADADIAIYPVKVGDVDPTVEYEKVISALSQTEYTIKKGLIVCRNGNCLVEGRNTVYWVDPQVPDEYNIENDPEFIKKFERYYSVKLSNYPVRESYMHENYRIETHPDFD